MKKILITGFSGFVSYYFLDYLNSTVAINESIEILGIDLKLPEDYENSYKFDKLKLRFISMNLLDYNALEIAVTSFAPDYILHLASFSSVGASWKDPVGCVMNNTNIFLNLAEAVRKSGVQCRILSVGSSEEYGNVSKNDVPLTEDRKLNPVSPYAIARVSQELLSKCYVESMGLDIVLTRSFNHIGPRQKSVFVIPSFVKQIVEGKRAGGAEIELHTGDLSIIRDFTDVRDVVRAYWLLLVNGKKGELYNVCSGVGHTLKEMVVTIASIAGVSAVTVTDSEKIRPNDNQIIIGDNSKLKSHTLWKTEHTLIQTLKDMLDYEELN